MKSSHRQIIILCCAFACTAIYSQPAHARQTHVDLPSTDSFFVDLNAVPGRTHDLMARGAHLWSGGEAETALDAFNNALKLEPKSFYAHIGKSRAFLELNNYSAAMKELQLAYDLADKNSRPKIVWEQAFYSRENRKYDEATAFYKQLLHMPFANEKELAFATFQYGEVHERQQDFRGALTLYDEALKHDPSLNVYFHRAISYEALKNYPAALKSLDIYIEVVKNRSDKGSVFSRSNSRLIKLYQQHAKLERLTGHPERAAADEKLAASLSEQTFSDAPFRWHKDGDTQ